MAPPPVDLLHEEGFLRRVNLPHLEHTFAALRTVAGMGESVAAAKALAEGKANGKPSLFLYGGVGNGKTHLLEAIIIRLAERGLVARYESVIPLMNWLKRHYDADSGETDTETCINRISSRQHLVLDELTEKVTAWDIKVLEQIISYRYHNRLMTVLATNVPLQYFQEHISERILSRFMDPDWSAAVLNSAPDYRRRS